jgi:hypothetical protein
VLVAGATKYAAIIKSRVEAASRKVILLSNVLLGARTVVKLARAVKVESLALGAKKSR